MISEAYLPGFFTGLLHSFRQSTGVLASPESDLMADSSRRMDSLSLGNTHRLLLQNEKMALDIMLLLVKL